MGVLDYIREKKERFQDEKVRRQVSNLNKQNEILERERLRQGELAKAEAQKERLSRDVNTLKEYNAKVENNNPSGVKKFARGLSNAMNNNRSITPQRAVKPTQVRPRERHNILQSMQGSRSLDLGSPLNRKKKNIFEL